MISEMAKFAYTKLFIVLRMTAHHEELCQNVMRQVNQ